MEELPTELLETLLKNVDKAKNVSRILEVNCQKALGPGENYASDILRLNMTVALGSGRIAKRRIIVKKKNKETAEFVDLYGFFNVEIKMYGKILPLLEELMEEYGDTRDSLWPDYYGETGDSLIFEDLQVKGFKLVSRHTGQDLNHSFLTLKSLGRFHAMTSVLARRGLINLREFPVTFLARNDEIGNKFYRGGFQMLADIMESTWEPKWQKTATRLREIANTFGKSMSELYHIEDEKFQVLNHGDCWTNNMLFKYESGSDYPIGIRFVDYQLSHYNSYSWDLMYCYYATVKPELRREHGDELITAYHRELVTTLEMYGGLPENAPTREDVDAEMDRLVLMGLMVTTALLPITMADPADAMGTEDFMNTDSVKVFHNRNMYLNEKYAAAAKQDLEYFIGQGVI